MTSVTNGLARVMWGDISDKLGRENIMAIAFTIQGILVYLVANVLVRDPVIFTLVLDASNLARG